jgi:hypothetical protein
MAWGISHSPEAWENARANLLNWDREALLNALYDDAFSRAGGAGDSAEDAADVFRSLIEDEPIEELVEKCMSAIAAHGTCSNGGHEFYIDPEGFHTVPVDYQPTKADLGLV